MFDEEVVLVLVSAVELLVAHVALKVVVSLAQLAVTQQVALVQEQLTTCLLYTSPSPRDDNRSRMPSSA